MPGQLRYFQLYFFVGELLETGQRQRMHLDVVRDHKFHAQQTHAPVGQERLLKRQRRVAENEHRRCFGHFQVGNVFFSDRPLGFSGIDEPGFAFRTGDRDRLSIVNFIGRVAGADNGHRAQFAGDNGRVARASALVGDDGRRTFHNRVPVRVGDVGDQHLACL